MKTTSRTRKTFPVTVTHVTPKTTDLTPPQRRAAIFAPADQAVGSADSR